jgi:intergrase/recombinase
MKYLESKRYSAGYTKTILSYLTRHIQEITSPMDIVKAYANLTYGRQHNLNRALSVLLKFYEIKGYPKDFLNSLREAMPKDNIGFDLKVPCESDIMESLNKLKRIPTKYQALYNLLLDSGLRVTEALKAINSRCEHIKVNGFYRCTLGYFRTSKLAYAAYFTEATHELILKLKEPIKECGARRYYNKYGFVTPKYLRKYAFNKMIELGIPESVADFIQGRTPKKIGAKHYMALVRQSDAFYGRYSEYLSKLRASIRD